MASGLQVLAHVLDGALKNEDQILQRVQLVTGDDQFILGQFELSRALSLHPIPLTAFLAAEPPGTSRSGCLRDRVSAPCATVPGVDSPARSLGLV